MDITYLKAVKKQKKMTLQQISDLSGIPKRTVDGIFSEKTKNPRIDTLQAIERALGITPNENETTFDRVLTEEEKEFISLISQLTEDEVKELSNFADYIISKREK